MKRAVLALLSPHFTYIPSIVQVRFQNARRATHVYEGSAPLWKETVELPFQAPMNSFSPASLAQVRFRFFTLWLISC